MRGLSLACAAACVLTTLATAASAGGATIGVFTAPHGGFVPHAAPPAFVTHGGPPVFAPRGGPAFGGHIARVATAPHFAYRAPTADDRFGHSGGFFFSRTFGGEGVHRGYAYDRNIRYGFGDGRNLRYGGGYGYGNRFDRSGFWGAGLGYTGASYGYGYSGGDASTVNVSTGPLVLLAPNFEAFAGPVASAAGGPRIILVNRNKTKPASSENRPQVVYGDAPSESVGGPKIIYGDSWN